MDQCTHEVRLQYWKNIITQCQARPEGQTAKQWMTDHGICEQTYYLWQRRIRQETFALMQTQPPALPEIAEKEICFAEIPVPQADQPALHSERDLSVNPVAVIKADNCTIALSADIPDTLLTRILREVNHA
ncbi:MAG: IS66 family insertion sequence element accessory protein TnpB [Suilimivivens sp.]